MKRLSTFIAGALIVIAAVAPARAADDCQATFSIELSKQEGSVLEFEIEVTTNASRARVEYNLLVNTTTDSGESRTNTVPRLVKINDTTSHEFVNYKLESGQKLVSYEVKQVSCKSEG